MYWEIRRMPKWLSYSLLGFFFLVGTVWELKLLHLEIVQHFYIKVKVYK